MKDPSKVEFEIGWVTIGFRIGVGFFLASLVLIVPLWVFVGVLRMR